MPVNDVRARFIGPLFDGPREVEADAVVPMSRVPHPEQENPWHPNPRRVHGIPPRASPGAHLVSRVQPAALGSPRQIDTTGVMSCPIRPWAIVGACGTSRWTEQDDDFSEGNVPPLQDLNRDRAPRAYRRQVVLVRLFRSRPDGAREPAHVTVDSARDPMECQGGPLGERARREGCEGSLEGLPAHARELTELDAELRDRLRSPTPCLLDRTIEEGCHHPVLMHGSPPGPGGNPPQMPAPSRAQ